eukprot:6214346-Pleurochrysis_carterae.AAC.4
MSGIVRPQAIGRHCINTGHVASIRNMFDALLLISVAGLRQLIVQQTRSPVDVVRCDLLGKCTDDSFA